MSFTDCMVHFGADIVRLVAAAFYPTLAAAGIFLALGIIVHLDRIATAVESWLDGSDDDDDDDDDDDEHEEDEWPRPLLPPSRCQYERV